VTGGPISDRRPDRRIAGGVLRDIDRSATTLIPTATESPNSDISPPPLPPGGRDDVDRVVHGPDRRRSRPVAFGGPRGGLQGCRAGGSQPDLDALRDAARGDEAPLAPAADLPEAHGAGEITSSTRSPTRFIRLASSRRSRRRASGTCGRSQRRSSRTPSSRGGPTVAWSSRRRAGATATARPSPHRSRTVVPDQRRSDAPRPLRRSRRGRGGGANPNAEPPSAVRRAPGPVRERGRTRPCDCSTPATILSTAARRASGRTPPPPPRRAALDRDLRRACEDAAGLGSSATFTRIKRDLVEAGLLGTESVSQPVGRPRQRLVVARGALADASSPAAALAALRKKGL